ncbi:capsule polysaccharide export transporter permease [Polymorphum gilvum]|uniref:Capsule polysaccharide export transport system permease protein n=1 Tax=Polymorphum gilvum (strain LMG 25793 / CGMCC 1.9160 / SL003B-26A1) TaxID=991905 RepID=F2J3E4_POLGS|nr:capsule polysaccharide export transporter permease [Polymorphum gilvum]ADZ70969.1 Capsule polysaccharide export transport system permease protein [Polymorphum gilvum SL003B-26A1]
MSYELRLQDEPKLPARAADSVAVISAALRRAARQSRVPVSIVSGGGGFKARRIDRIVIRIVVSAFVVLFLLPTLLSGLYLFAIASDIYETEVRFVVRNGEKSPIDSLGMLSSLAQAGQFKDAYVIAKYIKSHSIIADLEKRIGLRERFTGRDGIDFLSRLREDATIEEFHDYWQRRVAVEVDNRSGSVILQVYAFTAQDAHDIAAAIVDLSEELVNNLTNRARNEALENSKKELDRAQVRVAEITAQFQAARNTLGILDADTEAEAAVKLGGEIRSQLVEYRQSYDILKDTLADDAPTVRILRAQISSLEKQLQDLQNSIGGYVPDGVTLADAKQRFDQISIEQKVAREIYVSAFAKYEAARAKLDITQVYLDVFLEPMVPQSALYPRRFLIWSAILIGSLAVWGGVFGGVVLVRDHWAR